MSLMYLKSWYWKYQTKLYTLSDLISKLENSELTF